MEVAPFFLSWTTPLGLLFTLAAGLVLYLYMLTESTQKRLSNVPGPPVPSKLLGHTVLMPSDKAPMVLSAWANEYGPLVRLQILHRVAILLTDPLTTNIVLRKGPRYLPKYAELYKPLELLIKDRRPNLVSSKEDAYYKAVRQGVAPCFSMTSLKQVLPLILDLSQRSCSQLSELSGQSSVDAFDLSSRITSDVMGHMLLNQDLKNVGRSWEEGPSPYMHLFKSCEEAITRAFRNPFYLWMIWNPEARAHRAAIAEHDAIMTSYMRSMMTSPPPEHTIAGHLLKVLDPATGRRLALPQLKQEMAGLLAAGIDTSSQALSWAMAALATHPEVQQQLEQELEHLGLLATKDNSEPRDVEWSDLSRLPYLGAVMKETLRLFSPSAGCSARIVEADAELCGYNIPKGTVVLTGGLPLAWSDAAYGPSTKQFVPDRWISHGSTKSPPGCSTEATTTIRGSGIAAAAAAADKAAGPPDSLPFSVGPRDCVGQALAKLEIQVVLMTVLGRFRVETGPELPQGFSSVMDRMYYNITLKARGGMPLRFVPRV